MTDSRKTAVAAGFFDGMHIGHRAVLDEARRMCGDGKLGVFTFDGAPELPKFGGKNGMLLTSFEDKTALMREAGADLICAPSFSEVRGMEPREFFDKIIVSRMNASYVCCGEDLRFGKDGAGNAGLLASFCREAGIGFRAVAPVCIGGEPVSSTRIRGLVELGEIEAANELLGHSMFYTLNVVRGRQIGRTIGFPTINQEIPPSMVHPKRGVYASAVMLDGTDYRAVTNIGVKPTVKSDDAENMETHIIGFSGDLYGRVIRVRLLSYIREEQRFDGLAELKEQLKSDKNRVLTQK